MRRGRSPRRSPSRPRRPVWDNPEGQLPGTGIRGDGENLYDPRSTQRLRGAADQCLPFNRFMFLDMVEVNAE